MNYEQWAESFQIFAKYQPDTSYEVAAEHDCIYAGRAKDEMSSEDAVRLETFGWLYDDDLECFVHYV